MDTGHLEEEELPGSQLDGLVLIVEVEPGPAFRIAEVSGAPVAHGTIAREAARGVTLDPTIASAHDTIVRLEEAWATRRMQRFNFDRDDGRYEIFVTPMIEPDGGVPRLLVHVFDRLRHRDLRRHLVNAAIVDALPGSVALVDGDGIIRAVNAGWVRFGLERSTDGVLADAGTSYLDITDRAAAVDPSARDAAEAIRSVLAGSVDIATAEYPTDDADESEWFTLRAAAVDVDGERWAVVAHEDVTTLRLAVDRWHSTFSNAAVPTLLVDRDGVVLDANGAFAALLHIELTAAIGRQATDFVHADDRAVLADLVRDALTRDVTPSEVRLLPADGSTAVVRAHPSSIVHGHHVGVVVQLVDLTSQRRAEARLLVHRELLELVAAGTPFAEVATAVAANIGRAIDQATGAVLVDRQPAALSPDLQTSWLPLVGPLVHGHAEQTSFPYRGMWSVTVLDAGGAPAAAVAVVTQHDRPPTDDDEHSAHLLGSVLRLALQRDAMVGAASVIDDPLRDSSRVAADDLRRGLTAGEVGVHYQPIVDLRTGTTVSLEALVRWQHPTRGFVPPPELIQVAEESGLIGAIGTLVLTTACRDLAVCRSAGATTLTVAVNLSARQLADPGLVPLVRRSLVDAGLDPSSLVVEITESVVVDDVDQVADALAELRRLGVRVAIDDFGTGYSSLLYLKRFPADELKVDRSFVQGLGSNDGDTAIVDAVVELGHRLGLAVVAEGVETSQQLHELRRRRCDRAQGYLLQRPVPAGELHQFLQSGSVDLGPEPAELHNVPGELEVDQLLSHLIDELSRLSHTLGRPAPVTSVDLTRFVAQTVDDLAPLLSHHDVHRFLSSGPIAIDVEPVAIRQILTNLLSNAVKFTEPGTRLDIAVARAEGRATVAVIDHGPGVPADREHELFGRFSRLGTSARGLGLGLHLSRSLARRQGGDLVHERTGGGGATFVLEIPT